MLPEILAITDPLGSTVFNFHKRSQLGYDSSRMELFATPQDGTDVFKMALKHQNMDHKTKMERHLVQFGRSHVVAATQKSLDSSIWLVAPRSKNVPIGDLLYLIGAMRAFLNDEERVTAWLNGAS